MSNKTSTKYPHGFRSPLDKSPDSNIPRPGEDTSLWACPPMRPPTIEMINLFRGIRHDIADHFGCGLSGAGPCSPDCAAFTPTKLTVRHPHYRRVPRALTDVQRRGGRGTP